MASLIPLNNQDKINLLEVPTVVTVDTEGMGKMVGFSAAFDGFPQGIYFPFEHQKGNLTSLQKTKVFELLSSKEALVMHNAMHDLKVFKNAGLDYRGRFYCTMLMAHWINEERYAYDLTSLSKVYGGMPKSMPEQMQAIINSDGWNAVPVAWMDEYSGHDSYITHQLFRRELPLFQAQGFDNGLWDREQQFIRDVILPMIKLGIKIDTGFCIREYMRGQSIMQECIKELGFKPSSPKALEKFFVEDLKLPILKHTKSCLECYPTDKRMKSQPVHTHTGRPCFDKDAMEEYDVLLEKQNDERAKTILRYRGWLKTTSSNYKPYLELCDDEGILHPGYNLHRTKTSRLSCSEPNLQQIPKQSDKDWNGKLKSAFIPRGGYGLWTVDYSQLQFRMTVAYAGVQELIEIFEDETRDVFQEMASQMGWLRDDVKTLVYLILFGGGGKRASIAFGVPLSQGAELVQEFNSTYPAIKKVAKQAKMAAMKQGYVAMWSGRRRHFPRGSAFYRAFNAVIQGGEAEIIKDAMIEVQETICDENCRLILQIHDEIVPEIKEGMEDHYLPLIQKAMVKACDNFNKFVEHPVKFKTSVKRWGEK